MSHKEGHSGGGKGVGNVSDISKMMSNMESPLNAQKDSAEAGPAAHSGLPRFLPPDPLGICPDDNGKGGR